MYLQLQHKLLQTAQKMVGITMHLTGKGTYYYNVIAVERHKGELVICNQKKSVESEEQLKELIPANAAVFLNIEGWGVLLKSAHFTEDGQVENQLVSSKEEFELYSFQNKGLDTGYVAIVRSDLLQFVLDTIQRIKINLVSVSAGPFSVIDLSKKIKETELVVAGNWQVKIKDHVFTEIKPGNSQYVENYKWNNDIVSSIHLPVLATIYQFTKGTFQKDIVSTVLLEDYSYKRLNVLFGWLVLVLLFLGLLVNFLLFDSYSKQFNQISGEYTLNENVLKELDKANEELKLKEDLIEKGGVKAETQYAWYCDRIVELMPSELVLTKLSVLPLEKKIQKGRQIVFKSNTIIIEGKTKDAMIVHRWIKSLNLEGWIKDVEMVYYGQEESDSKAIFNLELIF